MTSNRFLVLATDPRVNPKHPQLLCYRGTLFIRVKRYQTTGISAHLGDEGMKVGGPQKVPNTVIIKVNDRIKQDLQSTFHIYRHLKSGWDLLGF